MKLLWTPAAVNDLKEISKYIAEDNRSTARIWAAKLRKRARDAARNPFSGRVVPELGSSSIREVLLKSYRIIFRVKLKQVEILRIIEGHRILRNL